MAFRSDRQDGDDRGFSRSRGSFGGGRGFGGRSGGFRDRGGFGGRERRPVEMHDVVCDKCKKPCQVPFKPSSDKPVYCNDCFKKDGNSGRSSNSEQLNLINAKLDKIMQALKIEAEVVKEIKKEVEKEVSEEEKEEDMELDEEA